MNFTRSDLADLAYFMAIARHRSFSRAAQELGVTASALSHAMSALEGRRGVRLLNRTTRSVTLTAAGEELFSSVEEPLRRIADASTALDRLRDAPAGSIRISVLDDAAALLLDPVIPSFVERCPDVSIELSVDNHMVDVVERGFDAGIRYGGTVPEDMIALRLSAPIRWVAAAAPAYLERFGTPLHPADLSEHRCIGIRLGNDRVYRWEFEKGSDTVEVSTNGPVVVDSGRTSIALASAGVGITYGAEPSIQPHVSSGALRLILSDWAPMGEGFHIYYPGRRQVPTALRLLAELIREVRPLGL